MLFRSMGLLQDESELEEIVKMVGIDALSPNDRLKMETSRSIREDFLHQNSFHEIDTYSSLKKQYMMMKLILAYYENAVQVLEKGAELNDIIDIPVREKIGRFKYVNEDKLENNYKEVIEEIQTQTFGLLGKEER